MRNFKSFTSKEILKYLKKENARSILEQLEFYKKAHKTKALYQVWQEGISPKLIQSEKMMIERINYIHNNPVKRGYIDIAKHWRYSSARDYEGIRGLVYVDRVF